MRRKKKGLIWKAIPEDRLLDEIRVAQGSSRVNAEDFLETVAGFYEALDESGQADVLRRRGRVAMDN